MHIYEVSWAFYELFIDGVPTAMKKKKKKKSLTPFKKTSNEELQWIDKVETSANERKSSEFAPVSKVQC